MNLANQDFGSEPDDPLGSFCSACKYAISMALPGIDRIIMFNSPLFPCNKIIHSYLLQWNFAVPPSKADKYTSLSLDLGFGH